MRSTILLAILMGVAPGCGADSAADESGAKAADAGATTRCYGANDCPPGSSCNAFGYCTAASAADAAAPVADAGLPPEVEQPREPPAVGQSYIYVAIPAQQMVAKIHSGTLDARSVVVGNSPAALRTVPGADTAVVLLRGASEAVVLRSQPDGSDSIVRLETAVGLNQLAMAPDGQHAVAYFDVTQSGGELQGSLQDVTVLHLDAGKEQAVSLSVGFRPRAVQFSADSAWAFVITEQGVCRIELATATSPAIVAPVALRHDPVTEPELEEVLVTPDGSYALARRAGLGGIRVVDLRSGAITDLALPGDATDLDLTADGTLAVAVLREAQQVVLLDIPGDLLQPQQAESLSTAPYTAGQVELTADGERAFLFTNATSQEVLLVAELGQRSLRVLPLKKGVRDVLAAPDGKTALVRHNKVPGEAQPTDSFEQFLDHSHGYSLVRLQSGFAKLQITATDPGEVAFAPDSSSVYLLLADEAGGAEAGGAEAGGAAASGAGSVEATRLDSFQLHSVPLGSAPVGLGVIPATGKVYVAQSHPLGRVTFVDMANFAKKTVTGFELNSFIVE